jgi:hypothetical protein
MKKGQFFIFIIIVSMYSIAFAGNYKCIQTEDPDRQNLNEWKDTMECLEMVEESEGTVIIDKKVVKLNRNLQTGKLVGMDEWGNNYGVVGNIANCGKVIDPSKEVEANVKMIEKTEGTVIIDEKVVKLRRNLQTGKLLGTDEWGNNYGVAVNTKSFWASLLSFFDSPPEEIAENIELIDTYESAIARNGKKVTLTRNKQTGKLSGADAWGNCYEVPGNTKTNGQIIDSAKENPSNIEL